MKKSFKIIIGAAITAVILLVAVFGISYHRGVSENDYLAAKDRKYRSERIVYPRKFERVRLETESSSVYIHSGDRYEVKLTENKYCPFEVKVNHGELVVIENADQFNHSKSNRVEIIVPHRDSLSYITSYSDPGELKLNELTLNKLLLESSADCDFTDIKVNGEFSFNNSTGDIKILQSTLNNCTGNLDTGNLVIDYSQLKGKNSFSLNGGDFTVHELRQIAKMNVHLSTNDGDLSYLDREHSHTVTKKVANTKDSLTVDTIDGDIKIKN